MGKRRDPAWLQSTTPAIRELVEQTRRARITAASVTVLGHHGIWSTTKGGHNYRITEIVAEAGIARNTYYEVLSSGAEGAAWALSAALDTVPDLRLSMDELTAWAEDFPDEARLVFLHGHSIDLHAWDRLLAPAESVADELAIGARAVLLRSWIYKNL